MSREQKIGPILDGLGVVTELDPSDLVAGAVVVAKIVREDGTVAVHLVHSDGMSWLDELGLLTAALEIVRSSDFVSDEDE